MFAYERAVAHGGSNVIQKLTKGDDDDNVKL